MIVILTGRVFILCSFERNKIIEPYYLQIKIVEQNYYSILNSDIKGTWKVLKSLLNNDDGEITNISDGQMSIDDDKQMANELNNFFVNSIGDINECIPNIQCTPTMTNTPNDFFEFKSVSISDTEH